MKLTHEQVRHVANLARLTLTPSEVEAYQQRLSVILEAVDQLALVDTSGVEPTAHVLPGSSHQRADEAAPESGTAQALSNAPQVSGTSFLIPKVIE
jgi:aspartyl-tRNA(Asn)/glutamyl-tRNA(Gln) amidotransferase subunit C